MDPQTLPLYTIAALLSFTLSLLLLAFAYFQPSTLLVRRMSVAILILAAAFFGSGHGQLLPPWATVIGTNMALLSGVVVVHGAFVISLSAKKPKIDYLGWSLVGFSFFPFFYWGIVEPNGACRSIVFSFFAATLTARSAWLLLRLPLTVHRTQPLVVLGLVFAGVTLWMFLRGLFQIFADPVSVEQKGLNPTSWVTVFWYIVLVSTMTIVSLWFEITRLKSKAGNLHQFSIEPAKANLMLLWGVVLVLCLGIISEIGVVYGAMTKGFSQPVGNGYLISSAQPVIYGALLTVSTILVLAAILTKVIQRSEEQDQFMSMLTHELKTPLSVIRIAVSDGAVPSHIQASISRSVSNINSIVERCAQVDQLRHGLVVTHCTNCNVKEMLESVIVGFAESARIHLEADNLPSCQTDTQLLNVILINLIENAIKYSLLNSVVIVQAVSGEYFDTKGTIVTVCNEPGVAGMPDPNLVFRKYYRSSGAHAKTGSGLGLYIAERLAKKIGGQLTYKPSANMVTFQLWIPA